MGCMLQSHDTSTSSLRSLGHPTPGFQLHRLMKEFVEHSELTMGRMRSAFGSGERETLKREAHSLRGSATYVGGVDVSTTANSLEKACAEESTPLSQLGGYLAAIEKARAPRTFSDLNPESWHSRGSNPSSL